MIPVLRMFEVVVATAFYSGICYMIFEGTGDPLKASTFLCRCLVCPVHLNLGVCQGI